MSRPVDWTTEICKSWQKNLIKAKRQEKLILVISHGMEFLEAVCDTIKLIAFMIYVEDKNKQY